MKFATWNVNSLRARADRVEDWLDETDADVLTIQETKCRDENFPWGMFEMMGYQVAHFGFSQWNGVAIASRVGLDDVEYGFAGQPEFGKNGIDPEVEARAISATVGTKNTDVEPFRLYSLYVPNGRSLEDEHMEYKLRFLDSLHNHVTTDLTDTTRVALTGDFNIAPYDEDVWDMEFFLNNGLTHVSEPERAAFRAFEDSGLVDVGAHGIPDPKPTRTGTTSDCGSPRTKACALTSSWPPNIWPMMSPTHGLTAKLGRVRAHRTTCLWSQNPQTMRHLTFLRVYVPLEQLPARIHGLARAATKLSRADIEAEAAERLNRRLRPDAFRLAPSDTDPPIIRVIEVPDPGGNPRQLFHVEYLTRAAFESVAMRRKYYDDTLYERLVPPTVVETLEKIAELQADAGLISRPLPNFYMQLWNVSLAWLAAFSGTVPSLPSPT